MRSFFAAVMLCWITALHVWAVAPYNAPEIAASPLLQLAKAADRPAFDDLLPATSVIDHRVHVASLAPIEAPISVRDEPMPALDIALPRARLAKLKPRENLLDKAKKYIGTNPTGWSSVWCAKFIAMLAPDLAKKVDNPNWARDWASLPHTRNPKPGDIAVLKRGNGGHIGVVKAIAKNGDPILISGNTAGRHGHRIVAEGKFSKSRVIAYVTASL